MNTELPRIESVSTTTKQAIEQPTHIAGWVHYCDISGPVEPEFETWLEKHGISRWRRVEITTMITTTIIEIKDDRQQDDIS